MNYQKIDIQVGPRLAAARVEKNSICSCGMEHSRARPGRPLPVDLNSVRWVRFTCKGCGRVHETRVIDVWEWPEEPAWFLLDLLDISRNIPEEPKPTRWEKVTDNKVAPRIPEPRVQYGN